MLTTRGEAMDLEYRVIPWWHRREFAKAVDGITDEKQTRNLGALRHSRLHLLH
jgi:hypothetical protein